MLLSLSVCAVESLPVSVAVKASLVAALVVYVLACWVGMAVLYSTQATTQLSR
jgi:hypothetical protein